MKRSKLDRKILEEMILQRLKGSVDLFELMALERDVATSIERALMEEGVDDGFLEMSRQYIVRAWRRAGRELATLPQAWLGQGASVFWKTRQQVEPEPEPETTEPLKTA
jgi:hypothetical protein